MKRQVLSILVILCSMSMYASHKKDSHINYGVKAGFSSTFYDIQELKIAGIPINEYTAKSEISSFYTTFTRININYHYIQTEVTYNISNYTILFPTQQWNSLASHNELSSISTRINSIDIPLYYGYQFIKEGPYSMSFFLGPKIRIIATGHSRHKFEHFDYTTIKESIHPINTSITSGIGINIGRIFFDFTFEYGLYNISKQISTTDKEGYISTNEITFNRRNNMLSFSIGVMF